MCKSLINSRFITAINSLLKRENSLTKGDLSQKFGISQQKFTEILKERMNVGADLLASLIIAYPDISAEWLLTGEGSMQKSENTAETLSVSDSAAIKILVDKVEEQAKKIERLDAELKRYRSTDAATATP